MKKALIGFVLGLAVVLLLGADNMSSVRLSGHVWMWHEIYQSTLSGVTPEGECYLALTNSLTGRTEVFKITKDICGGCDLTAFEKGAGRVVTRPNVVRTFAPPQEK